MTDDDPIIREADDDVVSRPAEQAAEKQREEAFNAIYEWNGRTFDGISASRMDVWRSLCHKGGFPPLDPCFDDTDLFYPRAKSLIWLCLVDAKELRRLRAQGMDSLLTAYEAWVDKEIPHSKERDALTLGLRIFNQAYASRAEVVPSGPDEPGKH
jgi:hypothetical protein